MKVFNELSIIVGAIGGFIAHSMGGYDSLLMAVVTLIIVDYITGLMKAISTKQISSEIGFKGIAKKVMILLIIATSVVIQSVIASAVPIREITIMFFIANEGISILENAGEFLELPKQLRAILVQLRGEG